jgi:hypothetical protein
MLSALASIDLSFAPPFWTTIILNGLAVYAGFYAITTLERVKPKLEGKVIGTLTLFQCGMFLMVCSFGLTVLFTALGIMMPMPVTIYQLFMMGGVIAFAFTASKFASIVWAGLKE